jgi:UDP-glucuronate 4-epimerase
MSDRATLVTGAAGFIGFHVARRLLAEGRQVVGLDNLNNYYDPTLKQSRLEVLRRDSNFGFEFMDLVDRRSIGDLFAKHKFLNVVHLAAQAGVRYSIDDPHAYADANLEGFTNVLEGCRRNECKDATDSPVSFYAATKKANELMAYSYSHLYRIPVTGLRFFTIYGPWGRPDMAIFSFTKAIVEGRPIKVFNQGNMRRDFTYINDVTRVISRLVDNIPKIERSEKDAPARVYNVGNNHAEELLHVISLLEKELGRTAIKEMLPMQPGDVLSTYADVEDLARDVGFVPSTPIADGIAQFAKWYRDYNGI